MFLTQVEVHEFGPFGDASLDLPQSGTTLIAGPNNSGKSAFLSAIDAIAGRLTRQAVARVGAEDGPRIRARFTLSSTERQAILEHHGLTAQVDGIPSTALCDISYHFEGGGLQNVFRVSGTWVDGDEVDLLRNQRDPNGTFQLVRTVFDSRGNQNIAHAYGGGTPAQNILELVNIGGVGQYVRLLTEWRSTYYHFYALRPGTETARRPLATKALDPTGANLPEVLMWLYHNDEERWHEVQRLISEIVPQVGKLVLPVEANDLQVAFEDPHVPSARHNLKNLGTGVEQLLMTVVVGLTHAAPSLVVIEEPETNLHPGAQRALLALLDAWSENRSFVVSTHSATMLDWTLPDRIWLVNRSDGSAKIVRAESDRASVLTGLGVRLSDVLSAERILLVEGPSDKAILEAWFPDEMRNPSIAVIAGGGGDDARFAPLFEEWLSRADAIRRKVLYLRDRDELSNDLLSRLEQSDVVYVIGRRELENYLLDADAITKALNDRRRANQAAITSEMVSNELDKAIDSMQRAVIVGRVCWQLQPIRPADHELRGELMRRGADFSDASHAILARLPNRRQFLSTLRRLWRDAEADVARDWSARKYDLAPGADVLDLVFKALIGQRFKKERGDGVPIARCLGSPPEDLAGIVRQFLG